jgi:hypothetical protein
VKTLSKLGALTVLKNSRILFPYLSGRWICSQILKVGTAQGRLADVGCPVHEDLELAGDDLHEVPGVLAVLGYWATVSSSSSSSVPARQGPKFTPPESIFKKLFGNFGNLYYICFIVIHSFLKYFGPSP